MQSRRCYEVAKKHNKPVTVMEPVKGGSLVTMTPAVRETFQAANPNASIASWAVRFVASLPGLITVLSGMSDLAQMEDNTSYMEHFVPLNEEEYKVIDKVVGLLRSTPTIPCTACKYCVDGCPMQINIPGVFKALNHYTVYNNLEAAKKQYDRAVKDGGKAFECLQCGQCMEHRPHHIDIIETLKKAAELFGE